ncbi:hypothetical protein [Xanthomonas campestris]|uniref:hypothetical protein n=1 Tax=Xanthomonas campestris TaxID=339 RepID=UPI002368A663|nr:hypothetical protein [Xanthomonas campestris]WDI91911.1 hypothetical protein JH280_11235 [Xanthomonas campestris]
MYAVSGRSYRAINSAADAVGGEVVYSTLPAELFIPTVSERNNAIRDAAWQWMSSVPKARGYDSIESCCSYAQSSVVRYKAEALAMIAWRDAVNQRLEQLALSPPVGVSTWEQVRPLLPQPEAFAWPAAVSLPLDQIPPIKLGA